MTPSLDVPHYSYETLRARANNFLRTYNPRNALPVPIEEIVEFEFGIDIVLIPGLQHSFEVAGFISGDLKTITVDEFVYESRLSRYRFTLAHELSHAVLHKRIYEHAAFSTIKEWMCFVKEMAVAEYEWLEYQAYAFAGLILAPQIPLKRKMEEAVRRARLSGLSIQETGDVAKMYIVDWLAKQFAVSRQVIEKRIEKDRLWSQNEME